MPEQNLPNTKKTIISTGCEHTKTITCSQCRLNSICIPLALTDSEIDALDQLIQRSNPKDKGEYLYRMNSPFTAVYAVRSGSYISSVVTESGEEQVTGFYLPGDVIGVDGIARQQYANNMVALERSTVCRIPFERLEILSASIPTLQRNLFRIMSGEISREQHMITLLGSCSAEQKLASFLISLSSRLSERGQSSLQFNLTMKRSDIANYLGLTIETVSRLFTQFKKKHLLSINNKAVNILDLKGLQRIVDCSDQD